MTDHDEDENEIAKSPEENCVPSRRFNKKDDAKTKSIIEKVFAQLGKPKDLLRYTVVNVYGSRYRVNVIRREGDDRFNFEDGRIGNDSFFITLSPEGEILNSNPPIVRRY